MRKEDQDFLRFRWYKNNDSWLEIVPQKVTRLSFSLLPAQSAALYCLEKTLFDNPTNVSLCMINTALCTFYVDDGLSSFACKRRFNGFL